MKIPYQFGKCWLCGTEQGPFSKCMHDKYKSNVWLCDKCTKHYMKKVDKGLIKIKWHASQLWQ